MEEYLNKSLRRYQTCPFLEVKWGKSKQIKIIMKWEDANRGKRKKNTTKERQKGTVGLNERNEYRKVSPNLVIMNPWILIHT